MLVTGSTGFLGGRLVEALLRRGRAVRALCRPGHEAAPAGAEIAIGDVTDEASLERAAAGASAILHVAARVSRGGTRPDFDRVNVQGLANVLRAAAAARVSRIVYTSSFFALGPSDPEGHAPRDEHALDGACADLDHYQASKRAAAIVARRAADAGAPLVTLYPGVLVGPGRMTEGNFVTALVRDHLCGKLVPLPAGGMRPWSYVHVDDVVAGHLAALDVAPAGSSFVLGGENASLRSLFACVADLTGTPPPRLSVPFSMLWALGLGEEVGESAFGRPPRALTRGVARVLDRAWALDSSAASRALRHEPRSLRATLVDTIAWLEARGDVPAGTLKVRA